MLHKDYYPKSAVDKELSSFERQGVWREDGLIGGKPPVVK
jgi:hypothetical protein